MALQEKIFSLSRKKNIWRYEDFYFPVVSPAFQITLEEGNTRVVEIPSPLPHLPSLYLKREDLNPNGSHKDRAMAYQVSSYLQQGCRKLLISSSGNAALSLAAYGARAGIEVVLFLSEETHPFKLFQLSRFHPKIIFTSKPINLARYASKRYGIPNLRPSVDDSSLQGYRSIAFEIYEEEIPCDSVFIFSTSGSSLLGIVEGFRILQKNGWMEKIPSIHAVQSGEVSSLAALFGNKDEGKREVSKNAPGHLGVKNTDRKEALFQALQETGGRAWWAGEKEIEENSQRLASWGINTSLEGAACLCAAEKAAREGLVRSPLVILTGHTSQIPSPTLSFSGEKIDTYNDLRIFLDGHFNPVEESSAE